MFHCPRFAIWRRNLNQALGRSVRLDSIVVEMLRSKEAHRFLHNDTNTERAAEKIKEEERSENKKANLICGVILKLGSCRARAGERGWFLMVTN